MVGQPQVTNTLKNALRSGQVAQAFLFCGPRGVGKTTCARILAKAVNCENLTKDFEPCNECPSCLAFNENASLNIIELDAASNNSVEDIRALIEQVRFARDLGFDTIVAAQHYLSQPHQMLQPIPLLGRLAAETGDMRLASRDATMSRRQSS